MDLTELTREHLQRTLDGERSEVRALIASLAPYVQARVTRVLHRYRGRAGGRVLQQEVDDLTQETFVELFERDARTLRSWDPARGTSLTTFAQIVAERVAISILRSGKRSPFTEDPTENAGEDRVPDSGQRPDRVAASRELLTRVLDRLKEELSPRGWELFHALHVEERDVEAICASFGMRADAVYAWRSRIGKRVRAIMNEIDRPSDSAIMARTEDRRARR